VTELINQLNALAGKENDYPAQVLLQWFISERVEWEKSAKLVVDQLKMAGDNPSAILILDRELGRARVTKREKGTRRRQLKTQDFC
jgi:ferritin